MNPVIKPSRRHILAASVTPALALIGGALQRRSAASKPNILFILADDFGYADASCYGRRDYRTPNIDRLAAEGVRLTQAYSNSPVCSPTRTALITGRYQYRLRVGLEEPLVDPTGKIGLPPDVPTLPSLLKREGYVTSLVGKWHLGKLPKFGPLKSGYDHFWGIRGGAVDYFTHRGDPREGSIDLWAGDVPIHQAGYLTNLLGAQAVAFIESFGKGKTPFFLSLHFTAPHWPWEAPYDVAESQRPNNFNTVDSGTLKTYAGMVKALDDQVGRVLQELKRQAIEENTIIIFTSDNGGERFSDTWPFTGKKTQLLEGGIRVPAIVRWPRRIKPGSTSEQVAISMDWLPTLLAAVGSKPDTAYAPDGINLLPMLTANAAPMSRKLYWRYRYNAQRAMRDGNMKWLKINENEFLFDLNADPLERANLKNRQPAVFRRLADDYRAWQSTMLPEDPKALTSGFTSADLADHF